MLNQPLESHDTPDASMRLVNFFDEFDIAFGSFDGTVIAERYAEPYLACRVDGSAQVFGTHEETARYFQGVLDEYASMGVRSCRHRDITTGDVGMGHSLGTVTWDLLDQAAHVVISWRESYVLVDDGDRLRVRTSIDHDA